MRTAHGFSPITWIRLYNFRLTTVTISYGQFDSCHRSDQARPVKRYGTTCRLCPSDLSPPSMSCTHCWHTLTRANTFYVLREVNGFSRITPHGPPRLRRTFLSAIINAIRFTGRRPAKTRATAIWMTPVPVCRRKSLSCDACLDRVLRRKHVIRVCFRPLRHRQTRCIPSTRARYIADTRVKMAVVSPNVFGVQDNSTDASRLISPKVVAERFKIKHALSRAMTFDYNSQRPNTR